MVLEAQDVHLVSVYVFFFYSLSYPKEFFQVTISWSKSISLLLR